MQFLTACCPVGAAPADPGGFNYPACEPLVNGELVTIEVISVNGEKAVVRSMDAAIRGFSRYVAGDVRTCEGRPVDLETDENGFLTQTQVDAVIAGRRHRGPSDISILFIPGQAERQHRGTSLPQPDGSHVVVMQTRWTDRGVLPLVSRERWWRLVIMHELCHALGVPCDRSHAWRGRHCTHPECILYPRVDVRAVFSAVFRLGPPLGLCRVCRREIHRVQQAEAGHRIAPEQPYDRMKSFDKLVESNPADPRAFAKRAEMRRDRKDYSEAIDDLTRAIELAPERAAYYGYRGGLLALIGRVDRAIGDYEACLQLEPDNIVALNNLAWALATCSDDRIRNGSRAVELARRACELSDWKKPSALGTLAAAHAEIGAFDRAVEYQNKAIALAEEKEAGEYRRPLTLYRARSPRRDSAR